MTNSFILHKGKTKVDLNQKCKRLTTYDGAPQIFNENDLTIQFSQTIHPTNFIKHQNTNVFLLPTAYDSIIDEATKEEILSAILQGEIYTTANSNWPSFIAYNGQKQQFLAYNSAPGYLPFYFSCNSDHFWLTTEAKAFINDDDFSLTLQPFSFFSNLDYRAPIQRASIFSNLNRLKVNELLVVGVDNHFSINRLELTNEFNSTINWNRESDIINTLHNLLNKVTEAQLQHNSKNGVALSGGYDSGSIAGLLHQNQAKFESITIGSSAVNEFVEAKTISGLCHAKNHSVLIEEESFLDTYLKMIYINEINDAVIAEGFVGIYKAYQQASKVCDHLYTGYGADILLGNLLGVEGDDLNRTAKFFLKRTALSGELSPFIADHFGLHVHPIYLDKSVINFCLSIPGHLKNKDNINKYIQRCMIEQYGLMPKHLLDIKKKGLHEGAGIPSTLGNLLGTSAADYDTKKNLLYNCLLTLFEEGIPPHLCDTSKILDQTKKEKENDKTGIKRRRIYNDVHAPKATKSIWR